MARIRPGGSERWNKNASMSSDTYEAGINSPRRDWAQSTAAAETNFQIGIQNAISKKSFGAGVRKAGSEKWKSKAIQVGKQRFVQGVQGAEAQYASGVAPFLSTIEATTLPPRFPKGDPRNLERVKAISEALRKKKTG